MKKEMVFKLDFDPPKTKEVVPKKRKKKPVEELTLNLSPKKSSKESSQIGTDNSDKSKTSPKSTEPVKSIQVTLDLAANRISNVGTLLMECIEERVTKHLDKSSKEYWWGQLNLLSDIDARTLFLDEDRFYLMIYAAEWIRTYCTPEDNAKFCKRPVTNPDYNPYQENVKQEGKHWGLRLEAPAVPQGRPNTTPPVISGAKGEKVVVSYPDKVVDAVTGEVTGPEDFPDPFTAEDVIVPVREQVQDAEAKDLEKFIESQQPVEVELTTAPDTYEQKWEIAAKYARKPREVWKDVPFELLKMIEWCYGWLQDTGELPEYPHDLIEIWWKRPTFYNTDLTPEAVTRRDFMVNKIRTFWSKSVDANRDTVNLTSNSYRITLKAMELEKLIEAYAEGADNEATIKQTAYDYFKAHLPIETIGVKPGPIDTLDPDFLEYLKLCQKYNITVGVLLHEANL